MGCETPKSASSVGAISCSAPVERSGGDIDMLYQQLAGTRARTAYETGEYEHALLSLAQSVALADRLEGKGVGVEWHLL